MENNIPMWDIGQGEACVRELRGWWEINYLRRRQEFTIIGAEMDIRVREEMTEKFAVLLCGRGRAIGQKLQ